jgi:hypothetical protein
MAHNVRLLLQTKSMQKPAYLNQSARQHMPIKQKKSQPKIATIFKKFKGLGYLDFLPKPA